MRLPRLVHNHLSYAGATIAALAFLAFLFLVFFHTVTQTIRAPYAGLVIFLLTPAILLAGLLLIPIGMLFEWRHWRRTGVRSIPALPLIDLNRPAHRNAALVFAVGSILLLFVTGFGSYETYRYTESVPFCGALCHTVMHPEYTTYRSSPHERVACVACHVGPGADWFVKSKLSGLYQVWAVTFDKYPRPIPTPIENLRPSRETCEQCHWPGQFFGGKQKRIVHFLADERNTQSVVDLLVRVGGGDPAAGAPGGIHWHLNTGSRIEYIAADEHRQTIPWVRVTELATGRTTTYVSAENPRPASLLAGARPREMDCMDCHNRPTHIFHSPSEAVDLAMSSGSLDSTLPFLKRKAVELLAAKYPSVDSALIAIDRGLKGFYGERYPEVMHQRIASVSGAAERLKDIYRENFFPEMKARWDVYPDNVGHLVFPGCARCHDGKHRSPDGKVITRDCTACHTIVAQGPPPRIRFATTPEGLPFQHPEDVGDVTGDLGCSGCHTGASP